MMSSLPNAHRIGAARAALTAAICAHSEQPEVADEALIELLTDLQHFCAARHIDFAICAEAARTRFQSEINGSAS